MKFLIIQCHKVHIFCSPLSSEVGAGVNCHADCCSQWECRLTASCQDTNNTTKPKVTSAGVTLDETPISSIDREIGQAAKENLHATQNRKVMSAVSLTGIKPLDLCHCLVSACDNNPVICVFKCSERAKERLWGVFLQVTPVMTCARPA